MSAPRVHIDGCGSEMQGVGALDGGKRVFVKGALPGEDVEIELTKDAGRYAVARLLRVLSPSPERREPVCPHYGACGGCQTQHMDYEFALSIKRQRVTDALARIGGQRVCLPPVAPSPQVYGYRNKAEFAVSMGRAGMFSEGSRRVIDIAECALQAPEVNRAFSACKARLDSLPIEYIVPRSNSKGEALITLSAPASFDARAVARDIMREFPGIVGVHMCRLRPRHAHALDGECHIVDGAPALSETLLGLDYEISPRAFLQVNIPQTRALYEKALSLANISRGSSVADVYCGAGTIALFAAARGAQVTGIEIVNEAVLNARANAARNRLSGSARFIQGDASLTYSRLSRENRFDAVFVDPPRKGLDAPVISALRASPCERLMYVSCDPATLARDIKLLTDEGIYELVSAHAFDMFPQTAHVETVVALSGK